jgi:hypothetical protein
MLQLPAEGRRGKCPTFPLAGDTAAEHAVWRELWRTPQAAAWERLGWTRVVARYVRALVVAEQPGADVRDMAEVRQMEDRLGLTPMAMLRLRWEIVADELAEARSQAPAVSASPRRVVAVDLGAVAGS